MAKIEEGNSHLASMRAAIDKLKKLGADTGDMEQRYHFLSGQIETIFEG